MFDSCFFTPPCDRSFCRSFGCSVVLSVRKAHERINRCRPNMVGMARGDPLNGCNSNSNVYNGAQRYEQFLQVGQLYWALILLGLALYLPSAAPLCLRS